MKTVFFALIVFMTAIFGKVAAQDVPVTGSYKHNSPVGTWSRGMKTTMYCGNDPESWVRGDASFDRSSGILSMTVQLETDATHAGPKGVVTAYLKDAAGKTIATATTSEIGIGGKRPGKSRIENFSSQIKIDPAVASQVQSVYLDAQCTGSSNALWGISLSDAQKAFNIVVKAASL
jgi:hypothetical protein